MACPDECARAQFGQTDDKAMVSLERHVHHLEEKHRANRKALRRDCGASSENKLAITPQTLKLRNLRHCRISD
jgi:hypothetical protein